MNPEGEKMDELKPCLFCGGLTVKISEREKYLQVCSCVYCGAEAYKDWWQDSIIRNELEDLRAQCKDYRKALENITRRKESEGIRDIYWAWADDALSKHEGK